MTEIQKATIENVKIQAIQKGLTLIADKPENMIFTRTIKGKSVRVSVSVDENGKIERVML